METRFDPRWDPFDPPEHVRRVIERPNPEADRLMAEIDNNDPARIFRAMGAGSRPGRMPMPEFISLEEVRHQASARIATVFKDWHTLKDILDRHEATIHKRWAKKTKAQRLKLLLGVWPDMPVSHRPDYVAFRKETPVERQAGTKLRDDYMWPNLNQFGLSQPKTLPLLLHARGRNTPDAFAVADEQSAHLGFVSTAIVPAFLNLHTMYFSGRSDPERYGEILAWEDNDQAAQDCFSRKAMMPGSGLVVLEIQERT